MAFDKVVDGAKLDAALSELGDSIRVKGGTSEKLDLYSGQMKAAVDAIKSGGNPPIVHGTFTSGENIYLSTLVYSPDYASITRPSYQNGLLIARVNKLIPEPEKEGCSMLITFYTPTQQFDAVFGSWRGGFQVGASTSQKTPERFTSANVGGTRSGYIKVGDKITIEEYELPAEFVELVFAFREVPA